MKVRVVIEPAEENDLTLSAQDQIRLWQEWVVHEPQEPMEPEEDDRIETP